MAATDRTAAVNSSQPTLGSSAESHPAIARFQHQHIHAAPLSHAQFERMANETRSVGGKAGHYGVPREERGSWAKVAMAKPRLVFGQMTAPSVGAEFSADEVKQGLIAARSLRGDALVIQLQKICAMADEMEASERTAVLICAAEAVVTIGPACDELVASKLICALAAKVDKREFTPRLSTEAERRVLAYEFAARAGRTSGETPRDLKLSVMRMSADLACLVAASAAYKLVTNRGCKTLTITFDPVHHSLGKKLQRSLECFGDHFSSTKSAGGLLLARCDKSSESDEHPPNIDEYHELISRFSRVGHGAIDHTTLAKRIKALPVELRLTARGEVEYPDLFLPPDHPFWHNLATALDSSCLKPQCGSPAGVNVDWVRLLAFVKGSGHDLALYPALGRLLQRAVHLLNRAELLSGQTLAELVGALRGLALHAKSSSRYLTPIVRRVRELIPEAPGELRLSGFDVATIFLGIRDLRLWNADGLPTRLNGGGLQLARRLIPYLRRIDFEHPSEVAAVISGTALMSHDVAESVVQILLDRGALNYREQWRFGSADLKDIAQAVSSLPNAPQVFMSLAPHIQQICKTQGDLKPGAFAELARRLVDMPADWADWVAQELTSYITAASRYNITEGALLSGLWGLRGLSPKRASALGCAMLSYEFPKEEYQRTITKSDIMLSLPGCGTLPDMLADHLAERLERHVRELDACEGLDMIRAVDAYAKGATRESAVRLLQLIVDKSDWEGRNASYDSTADLAMANVVASCGADCARDDVFELVERCATKLGFDTPHRSHLCRDTAALVWERVRHNGSVETKDRALRLDLHYLGEAAAKLTVQYGVELLKTSEVESFVIDPGRGKHGVGRLGKMQGLVLSKLKEVGVPDDAVTVTNEQVLLICVSGALLKPASTAPAPVITEPSVAETDFPRKRSSRVPPESSGVKAVREVQSYMSPNFSRAELLRNALSSSFVKTRGTFEGEFGKLRALPTAVNAALLSELMNSGVEAELREGERRIIEYASHLPKAHGQAQDLLFAKGAFANALRAGRPGVAAWYCELLAKLDLTPQVRSALLKPEIPMGDSGQAPILASLFYDPALRDSAIVYLVQAVPLLPAGDQEEALIARATNGYAAMLGLMINADDALLELYAKTVQAFASAQALLPALTTSGVFGTGGQDMPWIHFITSSFPGAGEAYAEFVATLGLQRHPDIERIMSGLDALQEKADHQMQIGEILRDKVKNDGSTDANTYRKELIGSLVRTLATQGLSLNASDILAVQQQTQTIAITFDSAERALLKYQRFPEKQMLLIKALAQFNDPATVLSTDEDDEYSYEVEMPAPHGTCTAELQVDGNLVSWLQVRDAQRRLLVSMRDCSRLDEIEE